MHETLSELRARLKEARIYAELARQEGDQREEAYQLNLVHRWTLDIVTHYAGSPEAKAYLKDLEEYHRLVKHQARVSPY